ncbi:MAG TPA: DUF4388 domain-containing protein [Vicinamibacteria bacterium]|nr:DUF4388 domain-containing protein [Vicinamibacteria bacterium]
MPDLPHRLQEALYDLGQYLSDMVAPLVVAEGFTTLMEQPPELVAAEIQNWTASQYHGAGEKLPVSDYLYHAVKKLMMLGDYGLVPKESLIPYLETVVPKLVEICPEADRSFLLENLRTLRTEPLLATPTAVIHRQAGSTSGAATPPPIAIVAAPGAAAPAAGAAPAVPPPAAPVLATARPGAVMIGLGQVPAPSPEDQARIARVLGLLMERYEKELGTERTAAAPTPQLTGQIVAAMAEKSASGRELNEDLDKLKRLGVPATMDNVFKFLGDSLPAWSVPQAGSAETPASGTVGAMQRIVAMAEDATEAAHRYHELVKAAVGQFNEGHLARAATMFELAEKLATDLKVKPQVVDSLRRTGHEALSPARLKEYCERSEKHALLRTVLQFYLPLRPDGVLGELQVAQKRDRRRLLLALMEAHGAPGRERVVQWLQDSFTGSLERDDWQLQRNLVLLLRRIPRGSPESLATEVEMLTVLADFDRPLPLVKEVIATLGATRSDKAEVALARLLQRLEERMLAAPVPEPDDRALLERVAASLIRQGLPGGRRTVIAYGLKTEPKLGDTAKLLVELGRVDLSGDRALLERLTKALHDALPRKMLGVVVKASSSRAVSLVRALAGTPAARPAIEEALRAAAGTDVEREARKILEPAAAASAPPPATEDAAVQEGEHPPAAARLSGDLELFGLPNLLHSLYHSSVVGTLHLEDALKNEVGWLQIARGKLVGASVDPLSGPEALYQLLERPTAASFRFRSQSDGELPSTDGPDILGLLMEGLRRSDELHRAALLAADEAALEPTGVQPRACRGEKDVAFLKALWSKAAGGVPPVVCEEDAPADAYRVRRQIAFWVEHGALKPRA